MNIPSQSKKKSASFLSRFQIIKKLFSIAKTKPNSGKPNTISNKAFLNLFYNSNAIMLLLDPKEDGDHNIIDANKAAEIFYGYTREELVNLHIGDINLLSKAERQKKMEEALRKGGNTIYFKQKLANNDLRDVQIFASPIELDNKIFMLLIIHDISKLTHAIHEIEMQQDYSQMLFDQLPDGLFLMDAKGFIIDGNKNAELIIGQKKEYLIGKNIFEANILQEEDKILAIKRMKDVLSGGVPQLWEYSLTQPDGHHIYIEAKAQLINYKDNNFFLGTIHDITKRKQQELNLKESEAKFRYLADFTFEWEYWINPEGKYIYISPSCEYTSGYPAAAFENDPNLLIEITHPDFRNQVQKHYSEETEIPTTHHMQFKIIKPTGEVIWIDHSCKPIFDSENTFLGKRGINRNITEEKLAKDSLEESNDRFRKISQITFEGIIIHKNGIIQDINLAFEKLSGYGRKELIGESLNLLINPEILKGNNENNGTLNFALPYETNYTKKNGEQISIEIEAKDYTIDGELMHVVAVRDITQRKKQELKQEVVSSITKALLQDIELEKLLQIIQAEINKLMDAHNFYFAVYDKNSGMINSSYSSDEYDNMLSFPAKGSLTGYLIAQKKSLLYNRKSIIQLIESNKIKEIGKLASQWLGIPLLINNEVIGAFVIQSYTDENAYTIEDQEILELIASQISIAIDRKQREEDLQKALIKAQESDRLKSAFLASMSHELRTPLNAIIGFSNLVHANRPIDEILDFCNITNINGNQLLGIVNAIFDLTLIESGELKLVNEEFAVSAFLENVFHIIKKEQLFLDKEDIDLSYNIPKEFEKLVLKTDKKRLEQVLLNLLKNAVKFTDVGSIKFGFSIIKNSENSNIQFYVEDTGIGIAKDKEEIIFDVFRQANESDEFKHDGVGLGLAISKRIINLMGGNIWLESTLGKGTTFYFSLPSTLLLENHQYTKKHIKNVPSQVSKYNTILIAEDKQTNYKLLLLMLKETKTKFLWAKNGKEAIDFVKSNTEIDLILMDIRMPIMNGLEAIKIIKEINPNIPIVAQTAYAISGDKELAFEAGCDEYLTKPIQKPMLIELLGKYLGQLIHQHSEN